MATGWVEPTEKALDDGWFWQDVNEVYADLRCVKEFAKGIGFGGDPKRVYTNTAYAIVEDPVYREIGGLDAEGADYELHFMGIATSGDTCYVQLWDIDNTVQLVEKTFTITTLDLVKSATFVLPTTTSKCRVEVKATTGGVASPFKAYGFVVVQK